MPADAAGVERVSFPPEGAHGQTDHGKDSGIDRHDNRERTSVRDLTEPLEMSFAAAKDVAEDRNTVIHGVVGKDTSGNDVFRSRGRSIPSSLTSLRDLTKLGETAAFP